MCVHSAVSTFGALSFPDPGTGLEVNPSNWDPGDSGPEPEAIAVQDSAKREAGVCVAVGRALGLGSGDPDLAPALPFAGTGVALHVTGV